MSRCRGTSVPPMITCTSPPNASNKPAMTRDADGFRDCMYEITWSGAIGNDYRFDADGEVVGLSRLVVEVLPVAERTVENHGYKVLGSAPTE